MVIDCLGTSLEDLFVRSGFQFTIKTVLPLARQLVSKLNLTSEATTDRLICTMSSFVAYSTFIPQLHSPRPQTKQYRYGRRQSGELGVSHWCLLHGNDYLRIH